MVLAATLPTSDRTMGRRRSASICAVLVFSSATCVTAIQFLLRSAKAKKKGGLVNDDQPAAVASASLVRRTDNAALRAAARDLLKRETTARAIQCQHESDDVSFRSIACCPRLPTSTCAHIVPTQETRLGAGSIPALLYWSGRQAFKLRPPAAKGGA